MLDCELILRFLSVRAALPGYAPPLKKVLNHYMEGKRNMSVPERQQAKALFLSAVAGVAAAFPDKPFRRLNVIDGERVYDKGLNRAVFDVQMQLFAGMDTAWITANRTAIRRAFDEICLSDAEFADSLNRATADRSRLIYRLRAWANRLTRIGATIPEPRIIPPAEEKTAE